MFHWLPDLFLEWLQLIGTLQPACAILFPPSHYPSFCSLVSACNPLTHLASLGRSPKELYGLLWTSQAECDHLETPLTPCFPGHGYYIRKISILGQRYPLCYTHLPLKPPHILLLLVFSSTARFLSRNNVIFHWLSLSQTLGEDFS